MRRGCWVTGWLRCLAELAAASAKQCYLRRRSSCCRRRRSSFTLASGHRTILNSLILVQLTSAGENPIHGLKITQDFTGFGMPRCPMSPVGFRLRKALNNFCEMSLGDTTSQLRDSESSATNSISQYQKTYLGEQIFRAFLNLFGVFEPCFLQRHVATRSSSDFLNRQLQECAFCQCVLHHFKAQSKINYGMQRGTVFSYRARVSRK